MSTETRPVVSVADLDDVRFLAQHALADNVGFSEEPCLDYDGVLALIGMAFAAGNAGYALTDEPVVTETGEEVVAWPRSLHDGYAADLIDAADNLLTMAEGLTAPNPRAVGRIKNARRVLSEYLAWSKEREFPEDEGSSHPGLPDEVG